MTLKTSPGHFRAVWRGEKTGELRKNDRDFQVGDKIELIEHDGSKWLNPYRRIFIRVTHIVRVNKWVRLLQDEEWVMLSFIIIRRESGISRMRWARCGDCNQATAVMKEISR